VKSIFGWVRGHEGWFGWLAIVSVITLVASALLIPWLVARVPADYFAREHHPSPWADRHPVARVALHVAKNLLGVVLIALGILMLVLPGQGVITVVAGVALLDIPGRHRFVQWMVSREPVLHALNWIRRKAGREEFTVSARRG
jgi:hypothetical protein